MRGPTAACARKEVRRYSARDMKVDSRAGTALILFPRHSTAQNYYGERLTGEGMKEIKEVYACICRPGLWAILEQADTDWCQEERGRVVRSEIERVNGKSTITENVRFSQSLA